METRRQWKDIFNMLGEKPWKIKIFKNKHQQILTKQNSKVCTLDKRKVITDEGSEIQGKIISYKSGELLAK